MIYYVALDQHTCLKPRSYICNSFTRQAGILQYPYFKRCFEPACMSVRVASTSIYVWISCIWLTSTSVVVWLNQQVCMLHLPQTRSYVCMLLPNLRPGKRNCTRPSCMYFTVAPDSSSHVFISCILSACMSVTVSSYQDPCIFHLSVTISSCHFPCL